MKNFVEVFYYIILDSELTDNDIKLLKLLDEESQNKVLKYRYNIDKKLSLYSKVLLQNVLIKKYHIGQEDIIFSKNTYGKPYLEKFPNLYFNISHTKNCIMCGISESQIGVDVERIDVPPYEIMNRCFSDEEIAYVDKHIFDKEEMFYRIWTRKESYVKWNGNGISSELQKINTLSPVLDATIYTEKIEEYVFSICSLDKDMHYVIKEIYFCDLMSLLDTAVIQ